MTKPLTQASHPRPFSTYYYGPRARLSEWSRIGRAASLRGAIRAATLHLFDGKHASALVNDESGVVVARLQRTPKGITVLGVFRPLEEPVDAPR